MITNQLQEQIVVAMKAHDAIRRTTLQLLKSELHNEVIAKQHELSDEEEREVVRREAKKRKDAIDAYSKAGNLERAETEKKELAILQEFLPPELDTKAIEMLVDEAIFDLKVSALADMGKVIGEVMKRAGGSADGSIVATLTRQKLTQA